MLSRATCERMPSNEAVTIGLNSGAILSTVSPLRRRGKDMRRDHDWPSNTFSLNTFASNSNDGDRIT